jgi:hypothetical protein
MEGLSLFFSSLWMASRRRLIPLLAGNMERI